MVREHNDNIYIIVLNNDNIIMYLIPHRHSFLSKYVHRFNISSASDAFFRVLLLETRNQLNSNFSDLKLTNVKRYIFKYV